VEDVDGGFCTSGTRHRASEPAIGPSINSRGFCGTKVALIEDTEPEWVAGRQVEYDVRLILGAELWLNEKLDKLGRLVLRLPKA
jgi:hypothetical protein